VNGMCNIADQEKMLAELRQADRQIKSGHYIRHEDMKAWLLSWGTLDHDLPLPKCFCGAGMMMARHAGRDRLLWRLGGIITTIWHGAQRKDCEESWS
jgi:hypothetical protein